MTTPGGWREELAASLRIRGPALGVLAAVMLLLVIAVPATSIDVPLTYGSIILMLLPLHGLVTDDLRSGRMLLWLQKPICARRVYLPRLTIRTFIAAAVLTAVVGLACVDPSRRDAARLLPFMLLQLPPLACLLFGLSAAGVHPDSLATFAMMVPISIPLLLLGEQMPDAYHVLTFPLIFPWEAVAELTDMPSGELSTAPWWRSAARVLGYCATWLGLGCAALAVRERGLLAGGVRR